MLTPAQDVKFPVGVNKIFNGKLGHIRQMPVKIKPPRAGKLAGRRIDHKVILSVKSLKVIGSHDFLDKPSKLGVNI